MMKKRTVFNQFYIPPLWWKIGGVGLVGLIGFFSFQWFNNRVYQEISAYQGELNKLIISANTGEQMMNNLMAITSKSNRSLTELRGKYILADELIKQQKPEQALIHLTGLENHYQVLAPYILWKRAQAHQLLNDINKSTEIYKQLIDQYPDHPVSVEGLVILGKKDGKLLEKAIEKFPAYDQTIRIIENQLQVKPNQPELWLKLLKYSGENYEKITEVCDKLAYDFNDKLVAKDWEAIAKIYWKKKIYNRAVSAYQKLPLTGENSYYIGLGKQYSNEREGAISTYQDIIRQYPNTEWAGKSLLRLVDLDKPENAQTYLEQAITNPITGGDGLLKKIEILTKKNDQEGIKLAQELLLKNFPKTNAAAEVRWKLAWSFAQNKNYQMAWELTNAIVTDTPNSRYAPRSSFWRGKWAIALGKETESKQHFQDTITKYPQSYYSWRSAKFLGQDVGDFNTIKNSQSIINIPKQREKLPIASPTLQELYQIGRHEDALNLWRTEIKNPQQSTITEEFITGLLQGISGDYFRGIATIGNLEDREKPEDQQEFINLKKQPIYWQGLYPLGYIEIINQEAKNNQINPYLIISIIRQESKFDRQIKSVANAVGLMQLIPSTAEATAKQIKLENYDLTKPEDNVKLGTTYINSLHPPAQNNSLLAIAGYNAGPGNVTQWVKKFGFNDPDEFVEKIPFPETELYVKNVLGNYANYRRIYP